MKLANLERKLIAAARQNPPSDRVPYAFEKRIMARLKRPALADSWTTWGRALWRATAPCITIMILLSAWTILSPANSSSDGDIDQELENTVMAAIDVEPAADVTQ